jgi:hypothetical protein
MKINLLEMELTSTYFGNGLSPRALGYPKPNINILFMFFSFFPYYLIFQNANANAKNIP